MSPDDLPALVAAMVGAIWLTTLRLKQMLSLTRLACGLAPRVAMLGGLVGCYIGLAIALTFVAAPEVRESVGYRTLFVAATAIALELVTRAVAVLGLDAHVDGLERNNPAARYASNGLWIGCTLCAIGANIGNGDEIITTLVPLILCGGGLILAAAIMSAVARGFASVTVERDRAAGLRMGAMFVAVSIPLAHAASGDWLSMDATLRDFASALPRVGAILALAATAEQVLARMPRTAWTKSICWACTILPAFGYIALAATIWRLSR